MDPIHPAKDSSNGASTPRELFALTDEQILEIGPQGTNDGAGVEQPLLAVSGQNAGEDHAIQNSGGGDRSSASALSEVAERPVQSREAVLPVEPPPWLAHMMADPRSGAEARDLWTGIQQARQEAAAFREVFAKPEEARAAAERSRALQEIDAAFYGGAGKPPEEASAARAALAQRLMREDPAAFREMVFAGLRALEEAGTAAPGQRVGNAAVHVPSTEAARQTSQDSSPSLGMTEKEQAAAGTGAQDAHVAAYRTFEKAANEDLERSVGSAVDRAVSQALPNADRAGKAQRRVGGMLCPSESGCPLQFAKMSRLR